MHTPLHWFLDPAFSRLLKFIYMLLCLFLDFHYVTVVCLACSDKNHPLVLIAVFIVCIFISGRARDISLSLSVFGLTIFRYFFFWINFIITLFVFWWKERIISFCLVLLLPSSFRSKSCHLTPSPNMSYFPLFYSLFSSSSEETMPPFLNPKQNPCPHTCAHIPFSSICLLCFLLSIKHILCLLHHHLMFTLSSLLLCPFAETLSDNSYFPSSVFSSILSQIFFLFLKNYQTWQNNAASHKMIH